ncbi:MAG: hypothetical protein VX589_06550 [Myxococcota bacterium]|nr:hypothetical protein [Myxococcota bacterium]
MGLMIRRYGMGVAFIIMAVSCSPKPVFETRRSALTAPQCADGTSPIRTQAARETITLCRRADGVHEGALTARYADGRPKVVFAVRDGKPHGMYRAWHPNGRRAVRQTFEHGVLVGERTVWPNIGPSTRCLVDECTELHTTLGRAFCEPDQISEVIKDAEKGFEQCAAHTPNTVQVVVNWWIDLQGQPYAVGAVEGAQSDFARCITEVIGGLQFPVPFGDTCKVTLPFEYAGTP